MDAVISINKNYKELVFSLQDINSLVVEEFLFQTASPGTIQKMCTMYSEIFFEVFGIQCTASMDPSSSFTHPRFIVPPEVLKIVYQKFPEYIL